MLRGVAEVGVYEKLKQRDPGVLQYSDTCYHLETRCRFVGKEADSSARKMQVATQWKDMGAFEDFLVERLTGPSYAPASADAED